MEHLSRDIYKEALVGFYGGGAPKAVTNFLAVQKSGLQYIIFFFPPIEMT